MEDGRPDPDQLLERVKSEEARSRRGRLKVFFGASPGVGKTYAMLDAARRLKASGIDVVIGWVETHGRAETELLAEGLPRLPPREVEYRGTALREFDLEAALARHPALLLLDELAHTNAPGSTYARRWQEVEELLAAGIPVWTTLNVQHIESLNDLVGQVTGVAVRETVPDDVLESADEVEFIDLPPEELLTRLAEGKVYVPDQAQRAARGFFRKGNLIALRELALRRTADRVDAQMQDYRRAHAIETTWPVTERILVCVRPNPESDRLVRAARRLATRLRADWIVAYVESPSQPSLSEKDRQALSGTVKLAEQLGAEVAVLSGHSVSEALIRYARERNVSKIVIGKPHHPRWRDRLRGSLLDALVRESGEVEVYIISGEDSEPGPQPPAMPRPDRQARARYVASVAVVAMASLLCAAIWRSFDRSNLIMIYLLGVAFVATRYGRGPSVLAAVLSVAAFDFFFVPPHLTFAVTDTQYLVTFAVMLLVGFLIATLAVRVRDQAEWLLRREQRTQTLFALSRDLTTLLTAADVSAVVARHAGDVVRGSAVLLLPDADGRLSAIPGSARLVDDPSELAVAQWVREHGKRAGLDTDTLPGASALYLPLQGGHGVLGVLAVLPAPALRPLTPDQLDLIEALVRQASTALDRALLAAEGEKARLGAEAERLRNTLLSSVSHDLRTPLAAITGAATCLLQEASLPAAAQRELKEAIVEEAERLNRRVANLLDMTRLESGSLALNREWVSLEELVGSALERVERLLPGRVVTTDLAPDLPLVKVDALLMEQVLFNLLENAAKYTPAGTPIRIAARLEAPGSVAIDVRDSGPGLPSGSEERVFEKFRREQRGPGGFGLGLAICRAIVGVHGGRIWAENLPAGGAVFRITLSAQDEAPAPVPEESLERDA